jgi:glutathione peroxidase
MKLYIFSFLLLITTTGFCQKSLYDYKVNAITGGEIDFNDLRGKLIVVINIASGNERRTQLQQLDTLCGMYAARGLVVVAFPTDDFNKEPKSNAEIRTWVSGLHPNIKVADKTHVKGAAKSAFFTWCTQKSENGMVNMEVQGDYQKFIISREGKIIAYFSGVLSPLAEPVIKTITAQLNN